MESKSITIYDIAKEAGVSPATVSRVLAGASNVHVATREKVQQVIDLHQFTPSSIAQGLLRKQSRTLGIILPDILHPYYAEMFTGAYNEAERLGYSLTLFRLAQNEHFTKDFMTLLISRRLDGIILSGGVVESTPNDALIPLLTTLRRTMPILTICPPLSGLDCINIYSDLSSSVRQSLHHLYNLGHRRIAFLGGSYESRSAGERELGFLKEMKKLKLSTSYRHEAGHTPEAGQLGVLKLFSSTTEGKRPTALICINDLVALGAQHQLHNMGLCIPKDVAVIGCDNQFFSPFTSPALTTVDLHPAEHGQVAVQQLVSSTAGEPVSFSHLRPATLIIRESCGAALGVRALK